MGQEEAFRQGPLLTALMDLGSWTLAQGTAIASDFLLTTALRMGVLEHG